MKQLAVEGIWYRPAYKRTEVTDDFHNAFGFWTDYQIINLCPFCPQADKREISIIYAILPQMLTADLRTSLGGFTWYRDGGKTVPVRRRFWYPTLSKSAIILYN